MRTDIKTTAQVLKNHDNFLILTHRSPDGDTLGSAYSLCRALKSIGKTAVVRNCDKIPEKYVFLTDDSVKYTTEYSTEYIIAVDVADESMLGELKDEYSGKIDMCIDHHVSNPAYAELSLIDADAAAAAEVVYQVICEMGAKIDDYIAMRLFTSIVTDTGSFKFSNTTPRSHRIAAELMTFDFDFSDIIYKMFDEKSWNQIELERLALSNLEMFEGGKIAVLTITDDMLKSTGTSREDTEALVQIPRNIMGTEAGITLKQNGENHFRVSMRSNGDLNVADVCRKFGGGGHDRAAGCDVYGTKEEAKKHLLSVIHQFL